MKNIASALLILALPLLGQDKPSENWKALEFLKGTWDAKTAENGAVNAAGTYTFGSELGITFWRGTAPARRAVKDRPLTTANMEIFSTFTKTLPVCR